jgi:hypothetical protein
MFLYIAGDDKSSRQAYDKFSTHNEANEQFEYEPHVAQQLDVEESRVSVRLLQSVKQSTSSLLGKINFY